MVSTITAIVMMLGGGFIALQTYGAHADVNLGANFTDDDFAAVAYWAIEGWPQTNGKKQKVQKENRFDTNGNQIGIGFRNYGRHGDRNYNDVTRDYQMTNWVNANLVNPAPPAFMEYDYNFRAAQNSPRDAIRIVRDFVNGVIFITYNHYTDFVVFAIGDATQVLGPATTENTNQGAQSEATVDDGEVENPPADDSDPCANPTPTTCPASLTGTAAVTDPLDEELMRRNDAMLADSARYSSIWYGVLLLLFSALPK